MATKQSNAFSFKGIDWKKIGIGAGVAVSGAVLTYIAQIIPTLEIPAAYLPIITALLAVLTNIVRKWASA